MTEQQTPDREKKIAEIREALEEATPGPWEVTNLGDVHITKDYRMVDGRHIAMWIADMCIDRENEDQIFADAHLIANAPEWLRFLLSELDLLKRGGWISVKERLPEMGEWVLAISTSGAQRVVEYRGQNRFLCPDGWRFSDVTHWMPLPPPPASETEIKPGDEVVHVDYPEYGVGIVKEISKSGKRAYVRFATPRWGLSFGAYYTLAKLRPAPKEEGA